MADHHKAVEAKAADKKQPKAKPPVVEERTEELAGQARLPGGPGLGAGDDTIQAQAARLSDPHFSTVQRQALARQIGRVQGNQHLQRVMASLKPGETTASDQPATNKDAVQKQPDVQRLRADPNRAGPALSKLPSRGPLIIQRNLMASFPTAQGGFEMGMESVEGAPTGGKSGLRGTIKFQPSIDAPYSNKIGLIQIVKLTDAGGKDINPRSMPATTGPHVRTDENPATGVEKGFFTDVLHQDLSGKNAKNPGDDLLPYYPFAPSGARKAGDIFGFKRSEEEKDIKPAELFDFPGTGSKTANLDFSFETVAKGDDNMVVYGAMKWSFGLRAGKVVNEQMSVSDTGSATFEAALEKHRDFYIHEPVTFYFDFDSDALNPTETGKIDTFLDYLNRFSDVRLDLTGFADIRGNVDYNLGLAQRRAEAVAQALITKGIDPARIDPPKAKGETTDFTSDVKSAEEQDRDAIRRANRRVTLTFKHTASILPK